MEIQSDFRDLLELFNKHKVEYLIVGGYALAFHGAPRYTGDLDIFINAESISRQPVGIGADTHPAGARARIRKQHAPRRGFLSAGFHCSRRAKSPPAVPMADQPPGDIILARRVLMISSASAMIRSSSSRQVGMSRIRPMHWPAAHVALSTSPSSSISLPVNPET